MPKNYHVAIVGATGAVGIELLRVMERRNFPVADLRLLASTRSAGKKLEFRGQDLPVSALDENSFAGIDLAFFSAGGGTSKKFAPIAQRTGTVVIDNSSAFRMDADVPLVIPEINPNILRLACVAFLPPVIRRYPAAARAPSRNCDGKSKPRCKAAWSTLTFIPTRSLSTSSHTSIHSLKAVTPGRR